ncbi:MAG: hypothetical protein ABEI58_00190 [Candidatus Nanohaloarchaea archaeon]
MEADYRLVAVFFVVNLFLLATGMFAVVMLGVVKGLTIFFLVLGLTVYVVYKLFVLKHEDEDS